MYKLHITLGYAQTYPTYRTYNGLAGVSFGKNFAPYVRCSRQTRFKALGYSGLGMLQGFGVKR